MEDTVRISSWLTLPDHICAVLLGPGSLALIVYVLVTDPGHPKSDLILPALALLILPVLLRKHFFLKKMSAGASGLLVSSWWREVAVPYANIVEVRQSVWDRARITTVRFDADTAFGREIYFFPSYHWRFWTEPPVIAMLEERARVARRQLIRSNS